MQKQNDSSLRADVAVIGAGLTGLVAARDLVEAGFEVIVLEAGERVGGRTLSSRGPVIDDLGAEFVHPTAHTAIVAEAERYGLSLVPVPAGEVQFEVGGVVGRGRIPDDPAFGSLFARLDTAAARLDRSALWSDEWVDLDIPWNSFLRQLGEPIDIVAEFEAWSFSLTGAPAGEVSAISVLRDLHLFGGTVRVFDDECRIAGGTQALADSIAGDLAGAVELASPVHRVVETEKSVEVSSTAGMVRARAAIVAVPVNALHRIVLELATDEAPAMAPHAGRATKNWVVTDRDLDGSFVRAEPVVLGFGRPNERRTCVISLADDGPVDIAAAMDLAGLGVVPGAPTTHDWMSDPWIGGTWMAPRPGQLAAMARLADRTGRVRFGGADLTPIWPGWMEGAVQSGMLLAKSVSEAVGPSRFGSLPTAVVDEEFL